jgi:ribosomal-protein-alanine N-acetyltransferase
MHFETEFLYIEPLSINDSMFILELVNTPGWLKFIGDRNVRTQEYAISYINRILGNPDVAYWTVRLKTNQVPIGVITLIKRDYLPHHDLGFAFLPQFSGKGYAYEATKKVIEELSKETYYSVLLAITIKNNTSSIKLLERTGFKFEKIIKVENDELAVYEYLVPLK